MAREVLCSTLDLLDLNVFLLIVRLIFCFEFQLKEQGSAYHECSIVFFTPGQYKVDIQCSSHDNHPTENKDQTLNDIGHTWKFTPPVAITVVDE
jgi:hypothetical protein